MIRILLVGLAALSWSCALGIAQTPYVAIYFDEALQHPESNILDYMTLDTMYVVAGNFNMAMSSIEYSVELDPAFLGFLGDIIDIGVAEGWSPSGVRISYDPPLDAAGTVVVEGVFVIWVWSQGGCPNVNIPVRVLPHPSSGKIQAVRWPDLTAVEAVGRSATICPEASIPVEDTTWGTIKGLYN